jgi:hypothetical protein
MMLRLRSDSVKGIIIRLKRTNKALNSPEISPKILSILGYYLLSSIILSSNLNENFANILLDISNDIVS